LNDDVIHNKLRRYDVHVYPLRDAVIDQLLVRFECPVMFKKLETKYSLRVTEKCMHFELMTSSDLDSAHMIVVKTAHEFHFACMQANFAGPEYPFLKFDF